MTGKTNISKRKVVRFAIAALLVLVCVVLLVTAALHPSVRKIKDIQVKSEDGKQVLLKQDIIDNARKIIGAVSTDDDVDLEYIETELEKDPWIANAEVYLDNKQVLQLLITERVPVARIFANNDKSYYLDAEGYLLPIDNVLQVNVPVFSQVPYLGSDQTSVQLAQSIASLGKMILEDSFWNAQITQIQVLPNGQFEMITLVGNHKIIFGGIERAQEKLDNLKLFYDKGLRKLGWDRYQVVDLRYTGQVVASPAIGYVAPIVEDTVVALPDPDDTYVAPKPAPHNEVEKNKSVDPAPKATPSTENKKNKPSGANPAVNEKPRLLKQSTEKPNKNVQQTTINNKDNKSSQSKSNQQTKTNEKKESKYLLPKNN